MITRIPQLYNSLRQPTWILCRALSFWFSPNGNGLQKAITNAEKLVGYPSTYSSLKYLAEEEPENVVSLAKKLVGSGHPLLSTARDLLSKDPHIGHHLGGLWVLLLSKAAGHNTNGVLQSELVYGIHSKQRLLAETTELINTAFLVHRSMVEIHPSSSNNARTLTLGNKLSVLGGDFLLAKASMELARLENTEVVELVSRGIGHLSEGAILDENFSVECAQDLKAWEDFVFLLRGSLLAYSCEGAVVLVGHEEKIRKNAFEFGKNLALAQQCVEDIESYHSNKSLLRETNLVLLLALNQSTEVRSRYQRFSNHSSNISSSKALRLYIDEVYPDVVQHAKTYLEETLITKCRETIKDFPMQTSVHAINSILKTVGVDS